MAEPVAFISRFRIKPGQRNAYEQLAAEVTPRIQAEWSRTLVYLLFLGPGDELTIIHVFGDAEAGIAALRASRLGDLWTAWSGDAGGALSGSTAGGRATEGIPGVHVGFLAPSAPEEDA